MLSLQLKKLQLSSAIPDSIFQSDVKHALRYSCPSFYTKSPREALSCSASLFTFIITERVSAAYKKSDLVICDAWESLAGALLDGVLVGAVYAYASIQVLTG